MYKIIYLLLISYAIALPIKPNTVFENYIEGSDNIVAGVVDDILNITRAHIVR